MCVFDHQTSYRSEYLSVPIAGKCAQGRCLLNARVNRHKEQSLSESDRFHLYILPLPVGLYMRDVSHRYAPVAGDVLYVIMDNLGRSHNTLNSYLESMRGGKCNIL